MVNLRNGRRILCSFGQCCPGLHTNHSGLQAHSAHCPMRLLIVVEYINDAVTVTHAAVLRLS